MADRTYSINDGSLEIVPEHFDKIFLCKVPCNKVLMGVLENYIDVNLEYLSTNPPLDIHEISGKSHIATIERVQTNSVIIATYGSSGCSYIKEGEIEIPFQDIDYIDLHDSKPLVITHIFACEKLPDGNGFKYYTKSLELAYEQLSK